MFCSSVCFVNIPKVIISLAEVRHPWDYTDRMTYFTGTPPHVRILSETGYIRSMKEALRYDVVSKMIYDLSGRHLLARFNQNKKRDMSRGFDMRK